MRADREAAMTAQAENQQREVARLSDRFEKQSNIDSRESYDRFGRQAEENFRLMQHEKNKKNEQIDELVKGNTKVVDNVNSSHKEELFKIKRQQGNENFRNYNQTNDKLEKMSESFRSQNREDTKGFNDELTAERRRSFEEARKNKQLFDLRMEEFKNQRDNEMANYRDATGMREKQLVDEKNLKERKLLQTGSDSLDTYRNRLSDNLAKTQGEANFASAKKDIENANALSSLNNEHKLREQDQRLSMERVLNDAKYTNEARETKQGMDADMQKRRGVQQDYLSRETLKKTYEDTIAELNAEHSRNLQGMQQKNQGDFDKIKGTFQKRISKLEGASLQADEARREKLAESNRSMAAGHLAERHRIIAAYEQKQKALEGTTKRTNESLGDYYQNERIRELRDREAAIAEANHDNVAKMAKQRMRLETINDIQNKEYKSSVTTLEDQHRLRSTTMAKTNASSIDDIQKLHELSMNEYQRESENMLVKVRADNELAMKNLAFDYESRIRNMAQNYEQKLSEQEMTNSRTHISIKLDNERVLRALAQRHRQELESVQDAAKKMLAIQETQYKDRMKLQDENQKIEVSKLRHSNELLRQRS
jgi:hypothetical protein